MTITIIPETALKYRVPLTQSILSTYAALKQDSNPGHLVHQKECNASECLTLVLSTFAMLEAYTSSVCALGMRTMPIHCSTTLLVSGDDPHGAIQIAPISLDIIIHLSSAEVN